MRRICLVGAGFISRVHAEALQHVPGVRIAAIVDPNSTAARSLAQSFRIEQIFGSVQEAIEADAFDCAHVLVPPNLHAAIALPLLQAKKSVLLEKPFAVTDAECQLLLEASGRYGAVLSVNQNFVFHPAFARLRRELERRSLGRPNFVQCIYNMPLRQMAARQFGHWMFQAPGNLLLEQAVHPLSQIATIAGPVRDAQAIAGSPLEVTPDCKIYPTLDISLSCRDVPAALRFAVGQSFPFWQITAVCDDGVIVADMIANRCFSHARTRWLDAVDGVASGSRTGLRILRDSWQNGVDYAASTLHLKARNDPFFLSMRGSISAFHAALDSGQTAPVDGRFGAMLVSACEMISKRAFPTPAPSAVLPAEARASSDADIAILGGTGFIGTHLVKRCVADGLRVAVMARSVRNLPAIFNDARVLVQRGDTSDRKAVELAIGNAPVVINLAHGGGAGSFEKIRDAMLVGARTVAEVCLANQVRRLVHIGSIASLYLGPQPNTVTGETPPDPLNEQRADYARAKALCDKLLLEMRAHRELPVCILRPGLVVGEGSPPFHTGLGFFNNEQHCLGWNRGTNPLPFVLVEDVAEAILLAVRAPDLEGRCYNLVGDVRLTAREYIELLAEALQRPLRFHPQSPRKLWMAELAKWTIKRATGRRVPVPTLRDIRSRGLRAVFDCSDAKRDLGWRPTSDRERFISRAILVHTDRS